MSEENDERGSADELAFRIAVVAAEELIRSEADQNDINRFQIPRCQADDHFRDCMAFLRKQKLAAIYESDDGYFFIHLQADI